MTNNQEKILNFLENDKITILFIDEKFKIIDGTTDNDVFDGSLNYNDFIYLRSLGLIKSNQPIDGECGKHERFYRSKIIYI